MALTPEDVVNKRFQPTKFREGYDQDEVDDFLDEVVVELRRLNQENEELRQRLVASDARISELQRSASAPQAQPAIQQAPAAPQAFQQEAPSYQQAPADFTTPPPAPTAAPEAPAPAAAPTGYSGGAAPAAAPTGYSADQGDPNNTNNLLQLARRLHEEHVREGVEKRDALIAEGQATAARLVQEAQDAQRGQISALDQERQKLEQRVEELRTFEREYRQKLKSYIEGQLRELDTDSPVGSSAPASAPINVPAAAQTGSFTTPPPAPAAQAAPDYQGFAGAN